MPPTTRSGISAEESMERKVEHIDIDKMWEEVSIFGRYQLIQICLIVSTRLTTSWHLLSYIFLGYEPDHTCNVPQNISAIHYQGINISADADILGEKCSIKLTEGNWSANLPCVFGYNYTNARSVSVLSEWDYICEDRDLGQLPQSLSIAGQGLGAILTFSADYLGRKTATVIFFIVMLVLTFSNGFVEVFWLFCILRFLTGACQQVIVVSESVLRTEIIPTKHRFKLQVLADAVWSVCILGMGLIAFLLQSYSWRILVIILSCSCLQGILIYSFMDETLRWYLTKGKTKKALQLIRKICKTNCVNVEDILNSAKTNSSYSFKVVERRPAHSASAHVVAEINTATEDGVTECKIAKIDGASLNDGNCSSEDGGCKDFFKTPQLLRQSFVIWFAWFVTVLAYYGLFLGPFPTVSDRFLQFIINCSIDLVSYIPIYFFFEKLTRRKCCMISHLVGGVALLTSTMLYSFGGTNTKITIVVTGLIVIGKLAVSMQFAILFLYTPEIFPTNISFSAWCLGLPCFCCLLAILIGNSPFAQHHYKMTSVGKSLVNTGLGVASLCGRFGGVIAPFSVSLANRISWAPGVVFGAGCLIVTLLLKFVPETSNKQLPQKINDMVRLNDEQTERNTNKTI